MINELEAKGFIKTPFVAEWRKRNWIIRFYENRVELTNIPKQNEVGLYYSFNPQKEDIAKISNTILALING